MSYGHQGLRETAEVSKVEEVTSLRKEKFRVTVSLNKERPMSKSPLYEKYDIQRYDLYPNYSFAHFEDMIPKSASECIDSGQYYVERITRALYYFKQCAKLRRQYKAGDLPYEPSLGDLINWATLIHNGNTPIGVAEETIIALTSGNTEVQDDVRRIIESVFIKAQ